MQIAGTLAGRCIFVTGDSETQCSTIVFNFLSYGMTVFRGLMDRMCIISGSGCLAGGSGTVERGLEQTFDA